MDKDSILNSKTLKRIILGTSGLVILVLIFGLGVFVGTKKADFSFKWAQAYHENFGGTPGGLLGYSTGINQDFTTANGVFGQIIKIDDSSLTVKGEDNVEKIIKINDETSVVYQKKNMKASDLKQKDRVVVIGEPTSNGQIEAEFIRVMPPQNPEKNNSQNGK